MCNVSAKLTSQQPSKRLNIEKASRDELVDFVKKQSAHTKKLEARCLELFEAYKKIKKEREVSFTSRSSIDSHITGSQPKQ